MVAHTHHPSYTKSINWRIVIWAEKQESLKKKKGKTFFEKNS
jgi:hypothetical protein